MGMQDAEIKDYSFKRLWGSEARPPYFAQLLFLFVGLLLVLSAFFILQAFVHGLLAEEQTRTSQDYVEDVVEDFYSLIEPLDSVSSLIKLSEQPKGSDITSILRQKSSAYKYYSQIIWFYKVEGKNWTFSELLEKNVQNTGKVALEPDTALLKRALGQGALNAQEFRLVSGLDVFQPRQHRQSPKVISAPFVIMQAVNVGDSGKGFLLAVLDVEPLYGESWLRAHKHIGYTRVRDVQTSGVLFEFERNLEADPFGVTTRQNYEFPFGGHNLEVSGAFVQDQRAQFLNMFPYIVGVFGLLLLCIGTFYIRNHQRQSDVLAGMNEALEQKNFELKAEAEERERLTFAIKDAEQKSRAVIDAVADIILETDELGRIVFLNKAWKKITGFDVEQSRGQSLVQLIHPQDQEVLTGDFQALLSSQKTELRRFTQLRMADGTFKAVELSMNVVRDGEGGKQTIIGTFTDIEERRRAERALSDAEKKYRSIVENAAGGIFQLTPEGLYLSANPAMARILGYDTPEQLLREVKNANEQLYIEPSLRQALYGRIRGEAKALTQEVQMRQRSGDIIWVQESIRCVQDDNGQLLFIEGSLEDITQRRESESAIHEARVNSDLANRAKSEFLSNMSHELRTPLNSIIGFSEMIKNEVYGAIEQRPYWDYAKDIHESGQKLLRVINEILDISKIEAGERQLNEGVVNFNGLIDSALDLLDVKIGNAQMIITRSLDNVPDVIGEELALKQVIVNLLSNAVKFTPDKGRITISGHVANDGRLHVSVTDTGIGLDDYEIQKALSPFGQVDSELARTGAGTGLGLTLVDALVKLHGGEFELFSQKGIGTTATIILPNDRIVKKKAVVEKGVDVQVQDRSKDSGAESV